MQITIGFIKKMNIRVKRKKTKTFEINVWPCEDLNKDAHPIKV